MITLVEKIVFNSKKWNDAGGDQPDGNEQFWERCKITDTYLDKDGDLLAQVQWPDGTFSNGHIVSMMRDV